MVKSGAPALRVRRRAAVKSTTTRSPAHPGDRLKRVRADRIYTGIVEAADLAGVSRQWLELRVVSGELPQVRLPREGKSGRCCVVYRLDLVLAVARTKGG